MSTLRLLSVLEFPHAIPKGMQRDTSALAFRRRRPAKVTQAASLCCLPAFI